MCSHGGTTGLRAEHLQGDSCHWSSLAPAISLGCLFMQREHTVPQDASQIACCRDEGIRVRLRAQGIRIQAHLTAMPVLFIQTGFQSRYFAFPAMTPGNQCERAGRCSLTSQGSLLEAAVCLAVSGHQVELLDHLAPRLTYRENQPEGHSGRRQEGLGLQLG